MKQPKGWLGWHASVAAILLLFLFPPLVLTFVPLILDPACWSIWFEWKRIGKTLLSSGLLMAGSTVVALLLGIPTAFLLFRSEMRLRKLLQFAFFFSMLLPLPLILAGWQMIFPLLGIPPIATWSWLMRMLGCIILHGLDALPFVGFCLGICFLLVERNLEEEAILIAGLSRAMIFVILPRCAPMIMLIGWLVALRSWQEITLTDFFQISTCAEEVYTQLIGGTMAEDSKAVAMTVPVVVLLTFLLIRRVMHWKQSFGPRLTETLSGNHYSLKQGAFVTWVFSMLLVLLCLFVPILGLLVQAARTGSSWSMSQLAEQFTTTLVRQLPLLGQSLLVAFLSGVTVSFVTFLLLCQSRYFLRWERLHWIMMLLLLVFPAPLLGFGLLDWIKTVITLPGLTFTRPLLWDGPSPIPNWWILTLRFLPWGWLIGWFLMRQIPRQLDESALLDGATSYSLCVRLLGPNLWPSLVWIAGLTAVLSLAELGASKIVTTPGFNTLSLLIFNQLHAGADAEVACLGLILLITVIVGGVLLWLGKKKWRC